MDEVPILLSLPRPSAMTLPLPPLLAGNGSPYGTPPGSPGRAHQLQQLQQEQQQQQQQLMMMQNRSGGSERLHPLNMSNLGGPSTGGGFAMQGSPFGNSQVPPGGGYHGVSGLGGVDM